MKIEIEVIARDPEIAELVRQALLDEMYSKKEHQLELDINGS